MASPKPKKPVVKAPVRPMKPVPKASKELMPKITKRPKSLNDFLKTGKKPPVKLKPGLKPGPDGMDVRLSKKTK